MSCVQHIRRQCPLLHLSKDARIGGIQVHPHPLNHAVTRQGGHPLRERVAQHATIFVPTNLATKLWTHFAHNRPVRKLPQKLSQSGQLDTDAIVAALAEG